MIAPEHFQEWLDSGVDEEIIRLNVCSLEGLAAYEHLLYSDKLQRTNPGVLARDILNTYTFLEDGGWWCSGSDPASNWELMLWGCFKPRRPRFDFEKRKENKYEHPPKTETRIFLLLVPDHIWQKVSDRYGIPIADEDRQRGFWHWVWRCNVPLIITEGVKKGAALLTAGYAAIALPGINGGYRTPKDSEGNKTGSSYLIPDLKIFATPGREVYLCFDRDCKPETVRNVNKAISSTGYLFTQASCKVRVISWQELEKGVDDFLVVYGADVFEQVYQSAQLLENWQARSFSQLTHPASLTVNRRYLGDISIPDDAKLVALRSPKGTGKTQFLESVVSDALARGQWVLVIGHRVQLVEALCHRFGIPYVTEVRTSATGAILGYGLCIDSLHPESQARFNAENWYSGVVVVDESEQVLWHALNSSTCQTERVAILRQLKTLLFNVLHGSGRVFLADADLSDLSIDFVRSLAAVDVEPWVVANDWQPGVDERWDIYHYLGTDPSRLVAALESYIDEGGRPLVVCSAQKAKSKWGTRNLEAYLSQRFSDKRILRIDSESIADSSHLAFGAIARLNQLLGNYDIVLVSPSIETGVSLDLKGHFTSCWGIFQGVQAESSVRQALSRLREPVPRHLWSTPYGVGKIGNGATSIKSLLASQHKSTRANIRLLQDAAFDDLDLNFQPESLVAWARMAVRVNLGMRRYRESILDGLKAEGHCIIEVPDGNDDELKDAIATTQSALHTAEAEAIAVACDITQPEFEKLQEQRAKTKEERYQERKYALRQRYAMSVTPDLVLKDDDGWHPQLRLHYFLTLGREYLPRRDSQRARSQFDKGDGAVFLPDFNRGQLSASVVFLEKLGILDLLDGYEITGSDQVLQHLSNMAQANRWVIKAVLGLTINEADKPIAIAQKLLGKCGLKLTYLGRKGSRNDRQRVYQYVAPTDGREEVFAAWQERDEAAALTVSTPILRSVSTPGNKEIFTTSAVDTTDKSVSLVSTPSNKEVITTLPLDKGLKSPIPDCGGGKLPEIAGTPQSASPGFVGALVSCQKFGRMFRFSLQRFIDGTTAEIKSVLTGELFTVPVSQLAPWGGAT